LKVKWLGHASFLITSDQGKKIVTDPYKPGAFGLGYGSIPDEADIVTVSHEHDDHNYADGVPGNPQVVRGPGLHQVNGIEFKGIACQHDESGGKERGPNNIFCFTVNNVRLCHLGDLGHVLENDQVAAIGTVDVLLIPVGGSFTIDARGADNVIGQINPLVVIPMHFKTARCPDFPVSDVESFLAGKSNVTRMNASEVEFESDKLPSTTEIMVLQPAL
jgi:L-ascorbate metabolism protein UlaG (beta-lactamase superfamily)